MNERLITEQDRENARRLKALWTRKKKQLGLTQQKAAPALGFKYQSTVSQYLNCDIALNAETVLKFAKLLQEDPAEIDPSMRSFTVRPVKPATSTLLVVCRLEYDSTGDHIMAMPPNANTAINPFDGDLPLGSKLYIVELGNDAYRESLGITHNSNVYILDNVQPQRDDIVFVRQFNDRAGFYRLIGMDDSDRTFVLHDPLTDTRLEIPQNNVIEFGVKVGVLEKRLADRTPWRN